MVGWPRPYHSSARMGTSVVIMPVAQPLVASPKIKIELSEDMSGPNPSTACESASVSGTLRKIASLRCERAGAASHTTPEYTDATALLQMGKKWGDQRETVGDGGRQRETAGF